jgi:hypothetical protein
MVLDQSHFSVLTKTTFQYIKDAMNKTLSMCDCNDYRFVVFTTVLLKMQVIWEVKLCWWAGSFQCYKGL